jgi:hypothetical protein
MKNKILFLSGLCLLLASGLVFTACSDEAQLVTRMENQLNPPTNITATYATLSGSTSKVLTVKWDAVDGASSYDIVATQEGKKSIVTLESYAGYPTTADIDKWEGQVYYGLSKGTFKIGVIANPRENHNTLHSDPGWATGTVTID